MREKEQNEEKCVNYTSEGTMEGTGRIGLVHGRGVVEEDRMRNQRWAADRQFTLRHLAIKYHSD